MSNFQITGFASDAGEVNLKAMAAVLNLAEVREFQKDVFENSRSKFFIGTEAFGGSDVITVFEVFPDHRTTYNRYRMQNDQVSRYDVLEDTWVKVQ